jgi:hypothetical protein
MLAMLCCIQEHWNTSVLACCWVQPGIMHALQANRAASQLAIIHEDADCAVMLPLDAAACAPQANSQGSPLMTGQEPCRDRFSKPPLGRMLWNRMAAAARHTEGTGEKC